ncbi:hypothetical protein [Sulfuracidifex tepidarius]|uniref:Uncharacterized protein n=1 Tax=Sulfuracidifex tepidarius TaxID=1294262 RepID=A0A510E0E1_9CREN|nr:hypothetical protein [Sulfuracidifex tepidarius]BBG25578.1 hypothetical protein IC007_0083 [Sulfuracidifex tepidarius]
MTKSHNNDKGSLTTVNSEVANLLDFIRRKYEVLNGGQKSERAFNTWLFQEIFNSIERYNRSYIGLDSSFILIHKLTRQFYYRFVPYVKVLRDVKREDLIYHGDSVSRYIDFVRAEDLPTVLSFIFPRNSSLINSKVEGDRCVISISQTADVSEEKFKLMIDYVVSLLGEHLTLKVDNVTGFHSVLIAEGVNNQGTKAKGIKTVPVSETVADTRDRLMRKFNVDANYKSAFSSTALSQSIRIYDMTGEENISQIFSVFVDFSDAGYSMLPCQGYDDPAFKMRSINDIPKAKAFIESIYPGVRVNINHKDILLAFPFQIENECNEIGNKISEILGESNLREKVICKGHIMTLKLI